MSKFGNYFSIDLYGRWQILPPFIQVYVKWFNFEELYKISQLEVDLHILDLSHLDHKYLQKKIWRIDYHSSYAHVQLCDVR